jgi:hypothetical protein
MKDEYSFKGHVDLGPACFNILSNSISSPRRKGIRVMSLLVCVIALIV